MLQPRLLARTLQPSCSCIFTQLRSLQTTTCILTRTKKPRTANTSGSVKRPIPEKIARKADKAQRKKEKKLKKKELKRPAAPHVPSPLAINPAATQAPLPSTQFDTSLEQSNTQHAFSSSYLDIEPERGSHAKAFVKSYTPRTPGVRHLRRIVNDHLWKGRAHLPLTYPKKGISKGGRNSSGRITVRHRGGGHARRIRTLDFYRKSPGIHTVDRIEYDPNRNAHIALITREETQQKSYILAADGMQAGDKLESYMQGIPKQLMEEMGGKLDLGLFAARAVKRGNCLPLLYVPDGTTVFNVGIHFKGRGQLCRGAGTSATVVAKDPPEAGKECGTFVTVRLQSGETRKVSPWAPATIGEASNPMFRFRQLGKAGRKRWLGIRPTVRGVAMNASKSTRPSTVQDDTKHMQTIILMAVEEVNRKGTESQPALQESP